MTKEFEEEILDALTLLIALRHPDIEETNFRRCNLIDKYIERGGEKNGWFTPNELAELTVLENECLHWLWNNGYPNAKFSNKKPSLTPSPSASCSN